MRITGYLHKLRGWARQSKKGNFASARVEATDLVVGGLGKPHHTLGINSDPIRVELLHAPGIGERVDVNAACVGIKFADGVGVEFGKPDVAGCVDSEIVGCAGQGERFRSIAGIGYGERGQTIGLVSVGGGEIVADVVGVLFGKPDGIIGGNNNAHDAAKPMGWYTLLEHVCMGIKGSEVIVAHFAKPEPSCVINCWTHQTTVCLGQGIFLEVTGSCAG